MTERLAERRRCVDGRLDCNIHCSQCGTVDNLRDGLCRWCRNASPTDSAPVASVSTEGNSKHWPVGDA